MYTDSSASGRSWRRPGVDQRRDYRMPRAPAGDAPLKLGLPAIQRPPARSRIGQPIGPVDQLIGTAHESVQSMHSRTNLPGKPQRGPVIGRIVSALHPPAHSVGRPHRTISARIHPRHPDKRNQRRHPPPQADRGHQQLRPSPDNSATSPHTAIRRCQGRASSNARSHLGGSTMNRSAQPFGPTFAEAAQPSSCCARRDTTVIVLRTLDARIQPSHRRTGRPPAKKSLRRPPRHQVPAIAAQRRTSNPSSCSLVVVSDASLKSESASRPTSGYWCPCAAPRIALAGYGRPSTTTTRSLTGPKPYS